MLLEIGIFIFSGAFLLFVLFAIPSLIQIRRTAADLDKTVQTLNGNLPAILANLEEISTHVNRATLMVNHQIEELSVSLKKLQRTVVFLAEVGQIVQQGIRAPFLNTLTSLAAAAKGVRVFLRVLNPKPELPGGSSHR